MKTLSGLFFAGADQAPQDFTTPLFMYYSINGNYVFNLNKNGKFR